MSDVIFSLYYQCLSLARLEFVCLQVKGREFMMHILFICKVSAGNLHLHTLIFFVFSLYGPPYTYRYVAALSTFVARCWAASDVVLQVCVAQAGSSAAGCPVGCLSELQACC